MRVGQTYPCSLPPSPATLGKQIEHLWDALNIGEATTDEVFATRIYDLLPSNPVFSHYMGSLTTPPCTEVREPLLQMLLFRWLFWKVQVCRR